MKNHPFSKREIGGILRNVRKNFFKVVKNWIDSGRVVSLEE